MRVVPWLRKLLVLCNPTGLYNGKHKQQQTLSTSTMLNTNIYIYIYIYTYIHTYTYTSTVTRRGKWVSVRLTYLGTLSCEQRVAWLARCYFSVQAQCAANESIIHYLSQTAHRLKWSQSSLSTQLDELITQALSADLEEDMWGKRVWERIFETPPRAARELGCPKPLNKIGYTCPPSKSTQSHLSQPTNHAP